MEAWYILKAYDLDELAILLDTMGIKYVNPVCLKPQIRKGTLSFHVSNLLGGYLFARLDIARDFYNLIHNEMFPANKVSILQTGSEFVLADRAVQIWKQIAEAVSRPLRVRMKNGQYALVGKSLPGAKVVHYERRKLRAKVELKACGSVISFSVAAYDLGNRSVNATSLAKIWRSECNEKQIECRRQLRLQMRRIREILTKIRRDAHSRRHPDWMRRLRPASTGRWKVVRTFLPASRVDGNSTAHDDSG